MILLVTSIERRNECAAALKEAMNEPVQLAENLFEATSCLREETCTIAIFDEQVARTESAEMENALDHLGAAIPVQVNLAISSCARVVREARAALRRRRYEEDSAHEAVARILRGKLNNQLTSLLLDCELALEISGLPAQAIERLDGVHNAAQMLRVQLAGQNNIQE
ncbi:MAG TPA: hypothetical protein VMI10_06255 [Terriglobales bacterium]|nr:hypothetical protein [Terriglobales bacterium]